MHGACSLLNRAVGEVTEGAAIEKALPVVTGDPPGACDVIRIWTSHRVTHDGGTEYGTAPPIHAIWPVATLNLA